MYLWGMAEEYNPFLLQGYGDPDNFCDRVQELRFLHEARTNQRNVTIISLRRLGKTALIRHYFSGPVKFIPVFVDIYRTTDQQGMILRIVEETLKQVGKPTRSLIATATEAFRSLELSLHFDAITGLPELGAALRPGKNEVLALDELFRFLEKQKKQVVLAIDEFQQITEYPEKNTEALLREHVQKLRNVNFIFSGSDRRMMQAIFTDRKRPFYHATEPLYLEPIAKADYTAFILAHFKKGKRKISEELVHAGLDWCNLHTYYVQYLFNRLFALAKPNYGPIDLRDTQDSILKERAPEYMTMKRLLSTNQAAVLQAIAKDAPVIVPTANAFIGKHGLSAVSTIRQSMGVLLEKELIHQAEEGYQLTDVFFGKWLAVGP